MNVSSAHRGGEHKQSVIFSGAQFIEKRMKKKSV